MNVMVNRRSVAVVSIAYAAFANVCLAQPKPDDFQPMLEAAALREADALSFNLQAVKGAIEDSDLPAAAAADCRKAVDAKGKELHQRYAGIKAGNITASGEDANSLMLLLAIVRSKIPDAMAARQIMLHALFDAGASGAAVAEPRDPTGALRKLLGTIKMDDSQRIKVDGILASLDSAAAREMEGNEHLDLRKDSADVKKWQQIQENLTPISRKAWFEIRDVLSKEQRRALTEQMPTK